MRAASAIVPTLELCPSKNVKMLPGVHTIVNAARTSAQCPIVSNAANIVKDLCLIDTSNMLRIWYAKIESKRRHECPRGTQECVRHNNFKRLRFFTENYMTLRTCAYATRLRRGGWPRP